MSNGTQTKTLTDFLLERIAEDEASALAASPSPWSFSGVASVAGGTLYDATRRIADVTYEQPEDHDGRIVRHLLVPEADANGTHIARHDPARVLAECAARRAILDLHRDLERVVHDPSHPATDADGYVLVEGGECLECHHQTWPCKTVRTIAAVYADHSDYDPAWAVS